MDSGRTDGLVARRCTMRFLVEILYNSSISGNPRAGGRTTGTFLCFSDCPCSEPSLPMPFSVEIQGPNPQDLLLDFRA